MAERGALLSCVPGIRACWAEVAFFLCLGRHISSLALPELPGEPEFQGILCGLLLLDISCHRLVRAADHSFRLRVPGHSLDHPAALPPARKCAALGNPAAVLLMGEHARILVAGIDPVLPDRRLWTGWRILGTG